MNQSMVYVGLDVHKETIAVAVAHQDPPLQVEHLGEIANRREAIRKLIDKLGARYRLRVCYEAGPCGYAVYRQLHAMKVDCIVVAPSLVPVRPGDRVKTDRRDALKLARHFRSGELTPVWVPDPTHEALRNLTRLRATAHHDRTRARHRLSKFLLKGGNVPPLASDRGPSAIAPGRPRSRSSSRSTCWCAMTTSLKSSITRTVSVVSTRRSNRPPPRVPWRRASLHCAACAGSRPSPLRPWSQNGER